MYLKYKGMNMAVLINDTCINCAACIDECPVEAIVDEDDNPADEEYYYVYPDKCVECVGHFDVPACAEACPTEGCITWDMPFTAEYKEHFSGANYIDGNDYGMENADAIQPFVESISIDSRKDKTPVIED
jgi:ferredoxin